MVLYVLVGRAFFEVVAAASFGSDMIHGRYAHAYPGTYHWVIGLNLVDTASTAFLLWSIVEIVR